MEDADAARAAIEALDGAEVDGRRLKVNEARERQGRR
jgi:RNA recognition motif-containing protein